MKLWDDIRNYFYKKNLAKRLAGKKTNRKITNLHDAGSIGIIYDSTGPDNDIIITKFAEGLRQEGKTIDILGFVNDTKTDHKADVTIFNKKNLSWTRIPQDERVEKFAARDFDLLLGCFNGENLPLEYIAYISQAKWRAGTYTESKTGCYDLMIKTEGQKDLPYLIEQTVYFLNQIKYDSN